MERVVHAVGLCAGVTGEDEVVGVSVLFAVAGSSDSTHLVWEPPL